MAHEISAILSKNIGLARRQPAQAELIFEASWRHFILFSDI